MSTTAFRSRETFSSEMTKHSAVPTRLDPRLCVMMFLQYAVWGIWLPIMPSYLSAEVSAGGLGFNGYQVGAVLAGSAAIGALVAPFLSGQFADRYFAAERYVAAAMLAGGAIAWILSRQTTFPAWMALSVLHAVTYIPTLGLTNSLAMAHLTDPVRQFPRVRVWGTIGWIAVAWVFPLVFLRQDLDFVARPPFVHGADRPDATARIIWALRASAVLSWVYALFCLTLPHTPPRRTTSSSPLAFVAAFGLLRHRSLQVLVAFILIVSALDRIFFLQTAPYLQAVGLETMYIMPAMALGQMAEIVMMILLGPMLARWGFRTVLAIGAGGYVVRYAVFGTTALPLELIVASQLLHGLCYTCSFAAAILYVNRVAPPDIRHSAQTGFTLIGLGIGSLEGAALNGLLEELSGGNGVPDYSRFWYACAVLGLLAAALAVGLFREEPASREPAASGTPS